MSRKTQSSIDWLIKKLSEEVIGGIPINKWDEIRKVVQQAKKKHKKEILDAYWCGVTRPPDTAREERYYNQKFQP